MAMTLMQRTDKLLDSSVLLGNRFAIQDQANTNGYLYLRGLIDKNRLLNLRKRILNRCEAHGWLEPKKPLMSGIARVGVAHLEGGSSSGESWRRLYDELQQSRAFHAMAHDPALIRAMELLFGGPALPHPRNIARIVFPGTAQFTTPPHQDFVHIGGTPNTWTAWIPCGDCPRDLGGLAIWPGSHRLGLLETHEAMGAGGKGVTVPDDVEWLTGDLECGDVLLFHSHTVHQALDNQTNRLRISLDYRYQPRAEPVRWDSLLPHYHRLSWDQIYSDWPEDDPLKHYWRHWDLAVCE